MASQFYKSTHTPYEDMCGTYDAICVLTYVYTCLYVAVCSSLVPPHLVAVAIAQCFAAQLATAIVVPSLA